MSKVTKLLHTRYRVNDLERTVKFYREILGLEETKRHKSPRGIGIGLSSGARQPGGDRDLPFAGQRILCGYSSTSPHLGF